MAKDTVLECTPPEDRPSRKRAASDSTSPQEHPGATTALVKRPRQDTIKVLPDGT